MKRTNTEKLKDVLLKQRMQNKTIDKKMAELSVINSWDKIMGITIASYTQEISIKDGTLFLKMNSPIIRNEIIMMREQIIEHVNQFAGGKLIARIVFR
ncbi:MAG: DUF721 domain-containing protein [Mangrovibacterium sp.]